MKKYIIVFVLLAFINQTIMCTRATTFSVTVPTCIHPNAIYHSQPKDSKPAWARFLQKYLVSTIAALGIGAITGLGSAEVEKRWVIQNGRSSEVRWFINFIGSALVRWNLVNLINSGMDEAEIPHDPNYISIGSWIADWGFYLYRR